MTLAVVDATVHDAAGDPGPITASRYTTPLANVALIRHVVSELGAAGVRRARVIAAEANGDVLRDALAGVRIGPLSPTVGEASGVPGWRAVLAELDAGLNDGPVLLVPGDGLSPGLPSQLRDRLALGDVDLVLSAGSAGSAAGEPRLTETAVMLGPPARPLVAAMLQSGDAAASLTDELLRAGLRLAVCDGTDGWRYDGSTARLLTGNRRVLDALPHGSPTDELAEANQLHGRVGIGRGVLADGCTIHGPVAIADDVVLEDSYIGPFTSIGAGATVSGTEIEDAIVLPRAVIRHPGHRITASIIGEGVRVERSFALPHSAKLRLATGSSVHFS